MEEEEYINEVMDEMEEEESEDQKEEMMEDDMDVQNELAQLEETQYPTPERQESTLKFLKDILGADDRFKTANLTWEELGKPTFSTRFWLNLSNTCQQLFEMPDVSDYCKLKARVTTDTSLSRDGFMVSTSVTQKRVKERKGGGSEALAEILAKKR